ncbi:hypothetical protein LXL04_030688 [Taraxacum kok-saghyz]
MEEEKAAAYYDELTRKGGGAARFKQGLGFSSSSSSVTGGSNQIDAIPARGSAIPSSSSFLSSFVKASSPSNSSEVQKQAQIESIQNKLKKKANSSSSSRVSNDHHSRGRESDKHSSRRRRSRSRSRSRDDDDERSRNRRSNRSSSRDRYGKGETDRYTDREKERRRRSRSRSRSVSPRHRRSEKSRVDDDDDRKVRKEKTGRIDHAKLIKGYDKMSPAERVKAKMKLQLSATAKQDEAKGMGSGWERFNFDKDAPLDDEEIEAAEDDGDLVKHINQTFRFSAVEARREEKIKATHDEAIFGTSSLAPPVDTDSEPEGNDLSNGSPETAPAASLISDQVRSLQQGSWRDRIRKG